MPLILIRARSFTLLFTGCTMLTASFAFMLQTWVLVRVCWYGFKAFCHEFYEQHPDHLVVPLRANGSAIETIFGQLKHSSGGTLTAVSYGPARSQLLTKCSVLGPHIRDEYRDAPLYIRESELPASKRPRKK